MFGDYSIMDLVSIGTLLTAVASFLSVILKMYQDSRNIDRGFQDSSKEHAGLSKEHAGLSKEHAGLSKEHDRLTKEHEAIKADTTYICDEMKLEKMAREALYKNTSRAREILETMDFMREVVLQNAALHEEVAVLKVKNLELSQEEVQTQKQLIQVIKGFDSKLVEFEGLREAEEVKSLLKKMASELSEYDR